MVALCNVEALNVFGIEPTMGVTAMRLAVLLCRDLVRFLLECDAYVRCDRQSYGRLWHRFKVHVGTEAARVRG